MPHRSVGRRAKGFVVSALTALILLIVVEKVGYALRASVGVLPVAIAAFLTATAAVLGVMNRFAPHFVPARARVLADLVAPSSSDVPMRAVVGTDARRIPSAPGVAAVGRTIDPAVISALPEKLAQLVSGREQATSMLAAVLGRSIAAEGRRHPLGTFLLAAERGAGATHFVHAVADALGQPAVTIDCTTETGIQGGITEAAQVLAGSPGAILVLDAADHLDDANGAQFAAAIRAGELVSQDGVRGATEGAVIFVIASARVDELGSIATSTPDPVAAVAKAVRIFDGMAAGERGRLPHLLAERCDAVLHIACPHGENLIRIVLERIEDVAAARGVSLAAAHSVDAEVMLDLVEQAERRLEAGVRFDAVVREIDRFAETALSAATVLRGPIRIDRTGRAIPAV